MNYFLKQVYLRNIYLDTFYNSETTNCKNYIYKYVLRQLLLGNPISQLFIRVNSPKVDAINVRMPLWEIIFLKFRI